MPLRLICLPCQYRPPTSKGQSPSWAMIEAFVTTIAGALLLFSLDGQTSGRFVSDSCSEWPWVLCVGVGWRDARGSVRALGVPVTAASAWWCQGARAVATLRRCG